jgi:hypothetical protein
MVEPCVLRSIDCLLPTNALNVNLLVINNQFIHIFIFNFSSCSHPAAVDPAWTEERQKMGGRTKLHN